MPTDQSIAQQLVGAWSLKSYVETNAETGETREPLGAGARGFILYTADGFMSAQMQSADRTEFEAGDMFQGELEEYKAAGQTYLAYSGRYEVDEEAGRVKHDIGVSLFPNWTGREQVRLVQFGDNTLVLRFEKPQFSNGALKTAELVWKRPV